MSRYIDAELIKYERHEKRGLGIDYGVDEESYHEVAYKKNIDKIPTANVQEIKQGHWVVIDPSKEKCSNCGRIYSIDALFMVGINDEPNCCPNCGAIMNEEANNEG